MSQKQIDACIRRLEAVSGYEAATFKVSMREADKMIRKGFQMRTSAWQQYREALGVTKKDGTE